MAAQEEERKEKKKRKEGGNRITIALLRKRSEHNEGEITSLEELALHQEELSGIDEILGRSCRKLKILLLQNNIIAKIENMHHMKDLDYLNLALNNISKIEGLGSCEFLRKLDLTVNFIDVDTLEESIEHLRSREHLRELYLMGNPCEQNWDGCKSYVVHRLPQLTSFDGKDILPSNRIMAKRQYPHLCLELRKLAEAKRKETPIIVDVDTDEAAPYTPQVRTAMYEEMAEEKDEKDKQRRHMEPNQSDPDKEQQEAIQKIRNSEVKEKKLLQKNEGKWHFKFDEDLKPHHLVLEVFIQRHLDSSLVDVDVHPHYVSVVIKAKTLRLNLPCEVKSSQSYAQRSKANGHLVIFMPKVDENAFPLYSKKYLADLGGNDNNNTDDDKNLKKKEENSTLQKKKAVVSQVAIDGELRPRVTRKKKPPSIGSLLLSDSLATSDDSDEATPSSQ